MKIKIGITGKEGFIGQHFCNMLNLYAADFEQIPYDISFFNNQALLEQFVAKCDVIIHLAALNRHHDPLVIYDTNIQLVQQLIGALNAVKSKAHIVFASSSQEEKDNMYGKSKRKGRELFSGWAQESGGKFTGVVIPNVFGPFGNPYYNSFIATFSHQLTHNEQPKIEIDGSVKLIYVTDLVKAIINEIIKGESNFYLALPHTDEYRVSEILALLEKYKEQYFLNNTIPHLSSDFEINLFNTFRSYINHKSRYPVVYKQHTDARGIFSELVRLNTGGQISFSTTRPGETRGNHFHTRKIERFSVIKGTALIQLRRIGTSEILNFEIIDGEPSYVDMPVWYTHNIKNIGDDDLYTVFWINEIYNPDDPDTYPETV
jgi:UDP-2-acetamido-2,6-beta-L-arabino-hexul-4-ose reductase